MYYVRVLYTYIHTYRVSLFRPSEEVKKSEVQGQMKLLITYFSHFYFTVLHDCSLLNFIIN